MKTKPLLVVALGIAFASVSWVVYIYQSHRKICHHQRTSFIYFPEKYEFIRTPLEIINLADFMINKIPVFNEYDDHRANFWKQRYLRHSKTAPTNLFDIDFANQTIVQDGNSREYLEGLRFLVEETNYKSTYRIWIGDKLLGSSTVGEEIELIRQIYRYETKDPTLSEKERKNVRELIETIPRND